MQPMRCAAPWGSTPESSPTVVGSCGLDKFRACGSELDLVPRAAHADPRPRGGVIGNPPFKVVRMNEPLRPDAECRERARRSHAPEARILQQTRNHLGGRKKTLGRFW